MHPNYLRRLAGLPPLNEIYDPLIYQAIEGEISDVDQKTQSKYLDALYVLKRMGGTDGLTGIEWVKAYQDLRIGETDAAEIVKQTARLFFNKVIGKSADKRYFWKMVDPRDTAVVDPNSEVSPQHTIMTTMVNAMFAYARSVESFDLGGLVRAALGAAEEISEQNGMQIPHAMAEGMAHQFMDSNKSMFEPVEGAGGRYPRYRLIDAERPQKINYSDFFRDLAAKATQTGQDD